MDGYAVIQELVAGGWKHKTTSKSCRASQSETSQKRTPRQHRRDQTRELRIA